MTVQRLGDMEMVTFGMRVEVALELDDYLRRAVNADRRLAGSRRAALVEAVHSINAVAADIVDHRRADIDVRRQEVDVRRSRPGSGHVAGQNPAGRAPSAVLRTATVAGGCTSGGSAAAQGAAPGSPDDELNDWIPVAEAAQRLRCSERHVRRLRQDDRLVSEPDSGLISAASVAVYRRPVH